LNTFIDRVSFERLGPTRSAALDAIATRLVLPPDQVNLLIESGAEALRGSAPFQAFRRGL
jgi:NTE family protein